MGDEKKKVVKAVKVKKVTAKAAEPVPQAQEAPKTERLSSQKVHEVKTRPQTVHEPETWSPKAADSNESAAIFVIM